MEYKRFLKNIPKEFGAVFDALKNLFEKEEVSPEKVASVKCHAASCNIPEKFLPLIAFELGCLYDWQYWGGLSGARIVQFRELRKLEGSAPGMVRALQIMDTTIEPESVSFEETGACRGMLSAALKNIAAWTRIDWQYLFYLISDYKRATLWITVLLERIRETDWDLG